MVVRLLVLCVVGLAGCAPRACEPGEPPTLTIGTGEEQFEVLEGELPEIELVLGPQGGYHTFIGLEATFLDVSQLLLGSMTGWVGGLELATVAPWLEMRCNTKANAAQSWGTQLIWSGDPQDLYGETATIGVSLTDIQQQEVVATIDVMIIEEKGE